MKLGPGKNNVSAAMLEMAVTFPITIMMVFFCIDLGRYLMAATVMNAATANAGRLIPGVEFERNITDQGCVGDAAGCERLLKDVQSVAEYAANTASGMVAPSSDKNASLKLLRFRMYHVDDYGPESDPLNRSGIGKVNHFSDGAVLADAVVLRPGDVAVQVDPDDNSSMEGNGGLVVNYPFGRDSYKSYVASQGGEATCGSGCGWAKGDESWADILAEKPVVVELYAEFKPILRMIPALTLKKSYIAFRTVSDRGNPATGIPFDPLGTATAAATMTSGYISPTATTAPTSTATVEPSPTPVLTPTRTPTRTITPTADCNSERCQNPTGQPDPYFACTYCRACNCVAGREGVMQACMWQCPVYHSSDGFREDPCGLCRVFMNCPSAACPPGYPTPVATRTRTATPVPPTATATNTPVPPTATPDPCAPCNCGPYEPGVQGHCRGLPAESNFCRTSCGRCFSSCEEL